jgi:hypothetical protein
LRGGSRASVKIKNPASPAAMRIEDESFWRRPPAAPRQRTFASECLHVREGPIADESGSLKRYQIGTVPMYVLTPGVRTAKTRPCPTPDALHAMLANYSDPLAPESRESLHDVLSTAARAGKTIMPEDYVRREADVEDADLASLSEYRAGG